MTPKDLKKPVIDHARSGGIRPRRRYFDPTQPPDRRRITPIILPVVEGQADMAVVKILANDIVLFRDETTRGGDQDPGRGGHGQGRAKMDEGGEQVPKMSGGRLRGSIPKKRRPPTDGHGFHGRRGRRRGGGMPGVGPPGAVALLAAVALRAGRPGGAGGPRRAGSRRSGRSGRLRHGRLPGGGPPGSAVVADGLRRHAGLPRHARQPGEGGLFGGSQDGRPARSGQLHRGRERRRDRQAARTAAGWPSPSSRSGWPSSRPRSRTGPSSRSSGWPSGTERSGAVPAPGRHAGLPRRGRAAPRTYRPRPATGDLLRGLDVDRPGRQQPGTAGRQALRTRRTPPTCSG